MKKLLQDTLLQGFPLLYVQKDWNETHTCMGFGFEVGNGWYEIIYQLSAKLEPLISEYRDKHLYQDCQCGCSVENHLPKTGTTYPCSAVRRKPYLPFKITPWSPVVIFKHNVKWFGRKNGIDKTISQIKKYVTWKCKNLINKFFLSLGKYNKHTLDPCYCKAYRGQYPSACQVKEKFGELHFYFNYGTEKMHDLITEAENKAAKTCEECSNAGKLRSGSWLRTLCDGCYKPPKETKDESTTG